MHLLQERVVNQCVHSRQFLSHSAHTNTKKKMYVQWSSSEAAHSLRWMQLSDFQSPTAFDLQRSAMSGVREALVCFVRVLCVRVCVAVIEQRILLYIGPVAAASPPNTVLCMYFRVC